MRTAFDNVRPVRKGLGLADQDEAAHKPCNGTSAGGVAVGVGETDSVANRNRRVVFVTLTGVTKVEAKARREFVGLFTFVGCFTCRFRSVNSAVVGFSVIVGR